MTIVMSEDLRRSRLLTLMDELASPDRDIIPKPRLGLTLWQTIRMERLQSQWFDTSLAAEVYEAIHVSIIDNFPLEDDAAINEAQLAYLDAESAALYLAGYRYGEQVAMVAPVTRMAIATAILAWTQTLDANWGSIVRKASEEDPWETAAEWAAILQHEADLNSPSKEAAVQWEASLNELEALHPERKTDLGELAEKMADALSDLRGYMFEEGRLDGEAMSGAGAR